MMKAGQIPLPNLLREDDAAAPDEQLHPLTGAVLAKAGSILVLEKLELLFGAEDYDVIGHTLDQFFLLFRGNGVLMDYCVAFKVRHEAAETKAGLGLNHVGKTHRFLSHAALNNKFVDGIMTKVDGDRE